MRKEERGAALFIVMGFLFLLLFVFFSTLSLSLAQAQNRQLYLEKVQSLFLADGGVAIAGKMWSEKGEDFSPQRAVLETGEVEVFLLSVDGPTTRFLVLARTPAGAESRVEVEIDKATLHVVRWQE